MGLPLAIPSISVVPDLKQIFMFSAATWNRHQIHYCPEAAVREGLPGVVVQRGLLGDFLARLLTEWVGDEADIRRLKWRVLRNALPGQTLRCEGEVVAERAENGARYLDCEIRTLNGDGELVAAGTAVVELRRPEG
jgi:hydroxyacyl-ACP dehydratase HTD2-like protein with hotdog domain